MTCSDDPAAVLRRFRERRRFKARRARGEPICLDCGVAIPSARRSRCPTCKPEHDRATWRRVDEQRYHSEAWRLKRAAQRAALRKRQRLEGDGDLF